MAPDDALAKSGEAAREKVTALPLSGVWSPALTPVDEDVARFEVGDDEDVRHAGDRRMNVLEAHAGDKRPVAILNPCAHPVAGLLRVLLALMLRNRRQQILDEDGI